ncbi:MAG: hypothetical protein BAJATHORv1_70097 [Candidatus Thorarchaeota archaeon]|nr:MAG: hypothetical protein BAJATHORv1_70097 [Candidatus Thorarchaeota archaeon]
MDKLDSKKIWHIVIMDKTEGPIISVPYEESVTDPDDIADLYTALTGFIGTQLYQITLEEKQYVFELGKRAIIAAGVEDLENIQHCRDVLGRILIEFEFTYYERVRVSGKAPMLQEMEDMIRRYISDCMTRDFSA